MLARETRRRLFPRIEEALRLGRTGQTDLMSGDPTKCQLSKGVHLIDEQTLIDRVREMNRHIWPTGRGTNLYAVKGNPNHYIMRTLHEKGFRFDCSSPTEIIDALAVGAKPGDIVYTANATPREHLMFAMQRGAAVLNLDDDCYLEFLEEIPKEISFRVNIGELRSGDGQNKTIGMGVEQKYGIPYERLGEAYRKAKQMGVRDFGLHTMYASNNKDWNVHFTTLKILLEISAQLETDLGIRIKRLNCGGGIGVDYMDPKDPSVKYTNDDKPFDIARYGAEVNRLLAEFELVNGWRPDFYLECARYVAAPAGIWVAPIVSVTHKYKRFACMEACDGADLLRAGIYPAHHHVIVLGTDLLNRKLMKQSIVGPLCENIHAAADRILPEIQINDRVVFCDAACHGIEMGMHYNGWTKSAQVLCRTNGDLKLIARAQTIADIRALQIPLD
jgi:diaminopimelate decarboxylase